MPVVFFCSLEGLKHYACNVFCGLGKRKHYACSVFCGLEGLRHYACSVFCGPLGGGKVSGAVVNWRGGPPKRLVFEKFKLLGLSGLVQLAECAQC